MPSERKQFNVRLSPEGERLFKELAEDLKAETSGEVTHADVVHRALLALARERGLRPRERRKKSREPT
jgi:bacterioferritin (cytochrome b1)